MPTVTPFSSPVLYEKVAQELNTQLALLGYFDDLYPVASIAIEGDNSLPQVYKNDGSRENFRLLPDSTRAMSFFVLTGDLEEIDEYNMNCPMALCVWMNLELVDATKNYDYTSEIVRDTFNTLRNYGCYNMRVDLNTPFSEFTELAKGVTANIMRPRSGFRINFDKTIEVCQP